MRFVGSFSRIASLFALGSIASSAFASKPGDTVDNFRLIDHKGAAQELYYRSDAKAVVLLTHMNGCDVVKSSAATLEGLRSKYPNVEFLMLNANLDNTREAIVADAKQLGFGAPIMIDETQLVAESLAVKANGEAFVVASQGGWKLAYRGAASGVGAALDAVLAGKPVATATTTATGCAVALPEEAKRKAHAQISYEKTIAPLLQDKCVACHREGGIGPWAMSSYDMVRGFSPMIREVVRTKRMPPWHADPHYGAWSNDRGLSNEQAKALVHWIEAGAPRGTGADPLAAQKKDWPKWALGEPDLVIETPPFTTPPTGVIPYQNVTVKNPLNEDRWIRAIDYLPGQRAVLHHIIASVGGERFGATSLNNYVPGAEPLQIPEGNGILLKANSVFHFQMHYTPNGQALTDVTRLGLYFMKEPPQHSFRSLILAQPRLKIPANTKFHPEQAVQTFKQDAVIYSLHPHAHFRGKSASFVAQYPDGREEMLINIPTYDFNWQATYDLAKPMTVPAGTKIVYTQTFDNSTLNKANPDPNRTVTWGEQTWDEMVFGVVRYRNLVETGKEEKPTGPSQEDLFRETPKTSRLDR
jgi:mono/diheme cytochrome c family protein